MEDELTKVHGIPVTIHDRTWIVDQTIDKERTDLAYYYLNVGEIARGGPKLGPNDYSRTNQLEDIERDINNPDNFAGMEIQLTSEALVAAKLSRNLELPREETDGRFLRAIRLAGQYGTSRQKLEAHYEHIWTAFWWFDDFDFLLEKYDMFEELVLQSNNAVDLEWLDNLLQLLVNSVIHGHVSADDAKFWERADRLEARLDILANEPERPNNQLEARSTTLHIHLKRKMLNDKQDRRLQIWKEYADVVDAARGLGEFNFDTLIRFIEVAGGIAGNDPAYNDLVEKCASAVAERKSETEAALMYLSRAKKLTLDDSFDMIRWLGKAAVGLFKKEYADELVEATYQLAVAYRSAGLLWAARASCAMAMTTLTIEAEIGSDIPVEAVPTTKLWAWISLELGHLPDTLANIQLMNRMLASMPLDDDIKERERSDLKDLDMVMGVLILNLDDTDLKRLEKLPVLLGHLDFHMAGTALLYALGHLETLRVEGAIPEHETDEAIADLMSKLKNQDVAENFDMPLVLNEGGAQSLSSSILGMRVIVDFDRSTMIPVAETVLGTLEAFFATAIEQGIVPHTEEYRIALTVSDDAHQPRISTDPFQMKTQVVWPRQLHVGNYERYCDVHNMLSRLAVDVLTTSCSTPDIEVLLERLFSDEAVLHRISIVMGYSNSYSRIHKKSYAQLKDWDHYNPRCFDLKHPRPVFAPKNEAVEPDRPKPAGQPDFAIPKNHKKLGVRSVIDVPTWDKAVWKGCGYLQNDHELLPIMALLFEDRGAGRKIFERWRTRFGRRDENDEIAISIIRNLPEWNPHHYIVQIGSKLQSDSNLNASKLLMTASRSQEMMPRSSENLERFLAGYRRFGVYEIIPGILPNAPGAQPQFDFDFAIKKRALTVKDSAEIKDNEPEAVALQIRGIKRMRLPVDAGPGEAPR